MPEREFWKKLIKFAIPIALQNVTVALFGIIDVSIISNMGEVAVSAVSIANQVAFITTNVTFGIMSGASVILSRCYGAKDKDGFRKAFAIMLLLSTILNSIIAVASLVMPRQIVAMYTDETVLIAPAATYLIITAVTNIMYGVSGSVVSFFRSVGIGGCVTVSAMVGREKHEEAKLAAKRYAVAGFEVGFLIMLMMLGINRPYVYTFFTDLTEETKLVSVGMIAIYALYMPFRSMASAMIIGSLRGLRDSVKAMYYDVLPIYLWAIPIGCLLAFVFDLPIVVVLAVMMFKRVIKCVLAWRRLYKL